MSQSSTWRSTFTNVPPLTKSVSTAMTVMTALGLALRLRDSMAFIGHGDAPVDDSPGYAGGSEDFLIPLLALVPVSAPYRFWTFATASFFERSIIQFVINMMTLLGCGKYLERAWGSREFFKFLAVTSVGTMLAIYFTCLFEYVVRGNEDLLYGTQAYGLTAVLAGFLVGFKQLVPEHLVTLWGAFSIRVKTLPMLFAVFMIVQSLLIRSQTQLLMAIYGLLISWVYSRFFKMQDGVRGDRSETFAFASFFPEAAQPPVKAVSNLVFGILVRLHICSPLGFGATFQSDLENPQMPGMILPISQPASLRAEAERRRALALKALDMRLHAAAGNSASLPGLSQKTFLGPTPSANNNPISLPPSSTGSTGGPSTAPATNEDEVLFETSVMDDASASSSSKEEKP
ncbi:MAG: eukaryotic integral membrane protein-domain-containing protein [Linnemannia gamsii]|nr:MAG: eukaryotic integral membrane protein-domain-containing protein [Linnemannia gamsii]